MQALRPSATREALQPHEFSPVRRRLLRWFGLPRLGQRGGNLLDVPHLRPWLSLHRPQRKMRFGAFLRSLRPLTSTELASLRARYGQGRVLAVLAMLACGCAWLCAAPGPTLPYAVRGKRKKRLYGGFGKE